MRTYIITALCATLAYAKPQYNYPAPASPSLPSGSYGAPGGGIAGQSFGGGSSFAGVAFGGNSGILGKQASGSSGFSSGVGGTLVQKHIYVHVAPPEPEELRPQRPISAGQSTKHYKIIFIKAPSYDLQQQQILQAQAQNEEKTLVYVLVKKPDDVADITLPTAAPTAPSKPEVYFIRYKARSEATASAGASASASASAGASSSGGQLIGGGSGLGISGSSLGVSGSNIGLSVGSSSSSFSLGRPSSNYGPPGQSGPY